MPPSGFAWVLPCLLVCLSCGLCAQAALGQGVSANGLEDAPAVKGLVTHVSSASNFEVDGLQVEVSGDTSFFLVKDAHGTTLTPVREPQAPYLGEPCLVFGTMDGKNHRVKAREVHLVAPVEATVSGTGIIDRVLAGKGGARRIRADGRVLEVPAAMLVKPAQAGGVPNATAGTDDLHTNVWVDYKGVQHADGVVTVEVLRFVDNAVSSGEGKLRARLEFDPAAVTEEQKQTATNKFFLGQNYRRIPAYQDATMQARIDTIGSKLVPAYQVALPETDATKIHFRFQLVDEPKWGDAITLPSGIILVPRQIVARLQDDSQLAAVLADNIATALEKQGFRDLNTVRTLGAANVAGAVGGIFVPGLGVATSIGSWKVAKTMLTHAEQQSGRVALCLMDDAGYDITQAPMAWWTLKTKEKKNAQDAVHGTPPERAVNQFQELGTTWRLQVAHVSTSGGVRAGDDGAAR